MKNVNIPTTSPDDLRKSFEEKQVTTNKLGEKEKLDFILTQLDQRHKQKVAGYNKDLVKTFGRILLMVNYSESQIIDRLGGGSLGAVDVQDGVIAFIMGYSESVQGHGIRYLCEYGVCRDGKIVSTGPMTYRGAYASEKDNWAVNYNEIKILEVSSDKVIFGVKSGHQLQLKERNSDGNSGFNTIKRYNLEEEERVSEEKKLIETLTTNWKDNLENIRSLISKKTGDLENVENPFVTDAYAIFPVIKHDRAYDATDTNYRLFIVGEQFPEPKEFNQGYFKCNRSSYGRRFFRDTARLSFKVKNENSVDLHIDYSGNYEVHSEDKVIKLPTSK